VRDALLLSRRIDPNFIVLTSSSATVSFIPFVAGDEVALGSLVIKLLIARNAPILVELRSDSSFAINRYSLLRY
jgi:hypothetical protein